MADKIDIKTCVGKRILARLSKGMGLKPVEISILEVSPSGEYIRIEGENGFCWMHANDYEILEVLPPKQTREMKQFDDCKNALLGFADDFLSIAEKHGIHVREKKP